MGPPLQEGFLDRLGPDQPKPAARPPRCLLLFSSGLMGRGGGLADLATIAGSRRCGGPRGEAVGARGAHRGSELLHRVRKSCTTFTGRKQPTSSRCSTKCRSPGDGAGRIRAGAGGGADCGNLYEADGPIYFAWTPSADAERKGQAGPFVSMFFTSGRWTTRNPKWSTRPGKAS